MTNLYFEMLRIRMIEEEIARKYKEHEMRCPVHLSIGQESGAVGICAGLNKQDRMVSTHRAHAHYLAKGGSLKGLIGELYGKATGCSKGNGGSMHLIDRSCNFFGSTSIVGGTIPIGVGIAFADRHKKEEHTTVICHGDAAIEEGVFHESANFASLHKLNVIFACENNLYSCFTHIRDRQPRRHFIHIASAHGLHYFESPPNSAEAVRSIVNDIKQNSYFPAFIQIPTYRYVQHCGPDNDDDLGYRDTEEIEHWSSMDFMKKYPKRIDFMKKIEQEIEEAFEYTKNAPFPEQSEIGKYVFSDNYV